MKKITIFYFEGCPNHEPTVDLVERVLAELGIAAVVESVAVRGSDDARRLRFFGSASMMRPVTGSRPYTWRAPISIRLRRDEPTTALAVACTVARVPRAAG
ncbi:MAG: hypothetical protein ACE5EO_01425 [Candidatus Krumholzibacteriia bacterium]